MRRPGPAAFLVGALSGFVAAVNLVRAFRPLPLLDPDPSWAAPRLLLGLLAIAGSAAAAGAAAGAFWVWAKRDRVPSGASEPLALSRPSLAGLSIAALFLGALLRFASLERLPPSLWIDDLSLIAPALELRGRPSDFANAIRPAPYGVEKPYGSVGVLYLEGYRAALAKFGTTVFGVRFLAAAAGACSIAAVYLLARELLPSGGAALATIVLAFLRWNLVNSRWGWNAVVLAPLVDVAGLLLVLARRRRSAGLAAAAGAVAGLAAHVYLAAWVGAAALLLFSVWPLRGDRKGEGARVRPLARLPIAFAAAFVLFSLPIFLWKEGRAAPYFARASDHNVVREMRRARSPMPLFGAAADSLSAPWYRADPFTGYRLLGWLFVPVGLAAARALAHPGEEPSAFFVSHGVAALAASVVGGQAGIPNGYRFGYLADVAAVAASSGILLIASRRTPAARRAIAMAAVGALAVSGALGARDALVEWPARRDTFDSFHGQDTLLGRAAARWESFGRVAVEEGTEHSPI
ncbi:MAG: glycosyltransferase family 39 protein, partial [Acidobacteriota bacterium]